MSVKNEVCRLLEANREKSLSGQEIAKELGVTRAAVWKAVNALKQEGYAIDAANNVGYRLKPESDVLSAEGIGLELLEKFRKNPIYVYKVLDSTNQEAKRKALEGESSGLVVLAEEQTSGKGRRGRGFFSPPGCGIYMSVLFRTAEEQAGDVVLVTTAAAVAVCRAIRSVLGEEPEIKWVNDVCFRGKKVCGILTEAISDFESGGIDTVVIGIGINYMEPEQGYPLELRDIVGAVCSRDVGIPRNTLIAAILNELYKMYDDLSERAFIEDYRRWSNVVGKDIRFSSGDSWVDAHAIDICNDGGLLVELKNGERQILHTGEISLRAY